jgi:hypothetical protein
MRVRSASAVLAAFLVLTTPLRGARAEGPEGAGAQITAEGLFVEAKRLMQQGNYADACPKLAQSQKLDPAAGTLLNLATCYEKNGQTASAWATFKAAASASDTSGRTEWATRARARAEKLQARLAHLTISVAAPVPGMEVDRDGDPLPQAAWGTPLPVDAGRRVVRATAPGRKPHATQIDIEDGAKLEVLIPPLEPAEPAEPAEDVGAGAPSTDDVSAPRAEVARHGNARRTIGLAMGGVGIAGVAVGAVFGLRALSLRSDASQNCNADRSVCTSEGAADLNRARTSANISTMAFIAGGALLAGGTVLILTAPSADAGRPSVAVGGVGTGCGVSVAGRW